MRAYRRKIVKKSISILKSSKNIIISPIQWGYTFWWLFFFSLSSVIIFRWAYAKFNYYMHSNPQESLVWIFTAQRNKTFAYIQSKWPLLFMLYYITRTFKVMFIMYACVFNILKHLFLKLNSQSKSVEEEGKKWFYYLNIFQKFLVYLFLNEKREKITFMWILC